MSVFLKTPIINIILVTQFKIKINERGQDHG